MAGRRKAGASGERARKTHGRRFSMGVGARARWGRGGSLPVVTFLMARDLGSSCCARRKKEYALSLHSRRDATTPLRYHALLHAGLRLVARAASTAAESSQRCGAPATPLSLQQHALRLFHVFAHVLSSSMLSEFVFWSIDRTWPAP